MKINLYICRNWIKEGKNTKEKTYITIKLKEILKEII